MIITLLREMKTKTCQASHANRIFISLTHGRLAVRERGADPRHYNQTNDKPSNESTECSRDPSHARTSPRPRRRGLEVADRDQGDSLGHLSCIARRACRRRTRATWLAPNTILRLSTDRDRTDHRCSGLGRDGDPSRRGASSIANGWRRRWSMIKNR